MSWGSHFETINAINTFRPQVLASIDSSLESIFMMAAKQDFSDSIFLLLLILVGFPLSFTHLFLPRRTPGFLVHSVGNIMILS